MINIEVNTDGKKVHCTCEINIAATRAVAIGEFIAVLEALEKKRQMYTWNGVK